MPDLLKTLFDSSSFMPRRQCGNWTTELIRLHIGSDVLIWLAYLTIPILLIIFVLRRRDLPFPWIFWMFGAFITTCGLTHLLEAAAFYWPAYRLMGATKLITAMTSWVTIAGLVVVLPRALVLLSMKELRAEIELRKRAERELRDSEERVRLLLDSTGEAIYGIDLDGVCTFCNVACLNLLGYDGAGDLLGRNIRRLIQYARADGTICPPEECRIYMAFHQREGVHIEDETLWRADGTCFSAEYWLRPVRRNGDVIGFVVTFIDITERKRSMEDMRHSEERVRLALNAGFMGTWDWEILTNKVIWSDNLEAILGQSPGSFDGTLDGALRPTHPADRERLERTLARSVEERSEFEAEYRVTKQDGSIGWLAAKGRFIIGGEGQSARIIGIAMDTTERKQSEEAIRQAEERLRLALEAGTLGTWDWDLLTNKIDWSDNLEAIFGLPPGHFDRTFDGYRRLIHPADRERVERTIARAIKERSRYEEEHRIVRPDGSLGWIAGKGRVLTDSDGQPVRVIGVATEITTRKRAEQDLREYAARLAVTSRRVVEVQEEERRHIARELHDEIGQVLSIICVNLHAIRGECGSAMFFRIDECLGIANRAVQQVHGLALDLRPSMLDDLGLAAALRWLFDRQSQRAALISHVAIISSGAMLPKDLAIACFRVAQEALTNVVRHARASEVWVDLRQGDEEVRLIIRDDGVGFDPEEARSRAARGESLGLMGIQERVGMLGGVATIEAAPGHGTIVTILLPIAFAPSSDVTDVEGDRR